MTDLAVEVLFPEGWRDVPAHNSPDDAMYSGGVGDYIITPNIMEGWSFSRLRAHGEWVWIARAVEKPVVPPRIFDQPNHQHYGPARRLWVMFAGLDLLGIDRAYYEEWGRTWDDHLVAILDADILDWGRGEAAALRHILYIALDLKALYP